MSKLIQVMDKEIVKHTYRDQPVITLREIDELHRRPSRTARRNFDENRKYFIEGVDYFSLPYRNGRSC